MNNIDEIIKKTSPAYVFFVIISGVAYVIYKFIKKIPIFYILFRTIKFYFKTIYKPIKSIINYGTNRKKRENLHRQRAKEGFERTERCY